MTDAAILVIGNEILSGRTRDANIQFLATELGALGIPLAEVRVVRDDTADIVAGLDALRSRYTYVFTSGGIGPTHDDITSASVAAAFGVALVRDPEAVRRLALRHRGDDLNAARLKMADIPAGASLIDNPISQAPGFRIGNVFVLAGVPSILQAMFASLKPALAAGAPLQSRSVTMAVREGDLAEQLAAIQSRHPEVEIGSYPTFAEDGPRVSIVARGAQVAVLDQVEGEVRALAADLGATVIAAD
jgi:molybdopterin-biosynthesis enzyme MoeA-like protein